MNNHTIKKTSHMSQSHDQKAKMTDFLVVREDFPAAYHQTTLIAAPQI